MRTPAGPEDACRGVGCGATSKQAWSATRLSPARRAPDSVVSPRRPRVRFRARRPSKLARAVATSSSEARRAGREAHAEAEEEEEDAPLVAHVQAAANKAGQAQAAQQQPEPEQAEEGGAAPSKAPRGVQSV